LSSGVGTVLVSVQRLGAVVGKLLLDDGIPGREEVLVLSVRAHCNGGCDIITKNDCGWEKIAQIGWYSPKGSHCSQSKPLRGINVRSFTSRPGNGEIKILYIELPHYDNCDS
jgi:hypothetical protein